MVAQALEASAGKNFIAWELALTLQSPTKLEHVAHAIDS
jgi:hypothetical protein